MKLLIVFISSIVFLFADLAGLRKQYLGAPNSAEITEELFAEVKDVSDANPDNTLVAYKAATYTLKAKHEKGLANKKNLFTQGAKLLEAVVNRDPSNYEARLIRMSIQENAPKITGYNKKIVEDKAFLIKNYKIQKPDLKEYTQGFVKASRSFNTEEKALFR